MFGLPRNTVLYGSLGLGAVMIFVFAGGLVRLVRRAVALDQAAALSIAVMRPLRLRLFVLILGIVIGAWFLTYGALSLILGV